MEYERENALSGLGTIVTILSISIILMAIFTGIANIKQNARINALEEENRLQNVALNNTIILDENNFELFKQLDKKIDILHNVDDNSTQVNITTVE